ncbi:hypothetical protein [Saccharothrix lopnurensis]|uniref:Uncharacterized protein n=1 Tax=Saccharothrix lopnurensis TaxID=1670621 RepID=A0ABW1P444_9PSEU
MTSAPERTALCAFGRCRAPLPPPGPRGGRPFEYCPERDWPGGHTCKQLAGAEVALTEALGKTPSPHLSGAASVFVDAADRVLEPMTALTTALRELRTSTATELATAAEQVEQARTEAVRERELRETATRRADQAEQDRVTAETARDTALADARTAREEHAEALRAREEAGAAQRRAEAEQRAAELELARVTAERDAAHRQAEQAAVTATATVAAITAAADQRVQAATTAETAAREQAAELRAELKALRTQLAERDHRLQAAEQAVERLRAETEQRIERVTTDAERRVERARADTAELRAGHDARMAELGAQTERADRLGRDRDHHRALLDRISEAVGRFRDTRDDTSAGQVDAVLDTIVGLTRDRGDTPGEPSQEGA